jgi:hypothetical protein
MLKLQDLAGWKCAFDGRWVLGWTDLQDEYYQHIRSRRKGRQWLAKIIRQIWLVSWDMWNLRNKALHETKQGLLDEQTQVEIEEQFAAGFNGFSHKVLAFTGMSKELVLSKDRKFRTTWLRRIKVYRIERDRLTPEELEHRLQEAALRAIRQRHPRHCSHQRIGEEGLPLGGPLPTTQSVEDNTAA